MMLQEINRNIKNLDKKVDTLEKSQKEITDSLRSEIDKIKKEQIPKGFKEIVSSRLDNLVFSLKDL